ncbi:type I-E CRISPR-associated protein Cas7/Cse4/CasC [Testudinibacter sp. TR-2022]|uniref:type I-E CRISPR-associated protein Cas7/Cse4/CasC n=1 Tax=Testudinibacter sp. TR-2022 TaxID=2585029 RepID=UPI001118FC91|nr:type I-E CRISPR-associated protein Cas7/Cse4/CasC [Testudinibacter sp. TR-2022]TNH02348.1 type I-E CRISPR-associated protein Cas7/Cse4/CasC [Pasteurellaceae bacterium Phil31]TNH08914.1 type I-E CRISPR-associated protein Cas7/Cse4/CasC [Testudinibacter sp. TR-2022]TNH11516.1 type I-E CRISPR-associated protein Cas7/Cse4/CasC [Testudinibacter sp. TR-2022]TNH14888.1 type I-E CRISPR-associated protein Cas7/Cse4/CasC [Testudinibacter sp. TR-2022]TNH19200.1 type I-E CRISPR-associated protein Cas7/
MINPLKNTRIEFHILQSFPVTCLNRDDVGAPKSALIGGVERARVSSQCWKRQVRLTMADFGIKLAVRTRKIEQWIAQACLAQGANTEQAQKCAEKIAGFLTKETLHFMTETEATAFAEYCQSLGYDEAKLKDKEVYKIAKKAFNPALDGLDIALFGRMVAQAAELNVEAAASFAHAISTHRVSSEIDFFTALDDRLQKDETGSGHMGVLQFNSATYYRYVSLDLGQLNQTLQGQDLDKAVAAFTKALYLAVPAARQTTQAGVCGWEYAKVLVRKGQGLQASFESAVKSQKAEGYLRPSIDRLKEYLAHKERLSGSLFGKIAEYNFGEDENFNIDQLVAALVQHVEVTNE